MNPHQEQQPGTTEEAMAELAFDTSVAHPARRYDYWLGGKDNFAADRASGDAVAKVVPTIRLGVMENRRFLGRAVNYLATEARIDQFLDIGTGIPSANNTHQVAQRLNPAARVVYVDNDPLVLAYARALLNGSPAGTTAYLDADLRNPEAILADPALTATLDLTRPVALMLIAVLHFLPDADNPYDIVRTLTDALPAGSYLAISHATTDYFTPNRASQASAPMGPQFQLRSREEFARFFDGHELVPPGIVSVCEWRADNEPSPRPSPADVGGYGAIGRIR